MAFALPGCATVGTANPREAACVSNLPSSTLCSPKATPGCCRPARGHPAGVSPLCIRVRHARNPFLVQLTPLEALPNGPRHQQSVLLPQLPFGFPQLSGQVPWPSSYGAAHGTSLTWCCWSFNLSCPCARLVLRGLSSQAFSYLHPSAI